MARLRWMENARTGDEGTVCTHDNKLFFDDDDAYINASASGTLDLVATTIAITGDLTVSGSLTYGSAAVNLNQNLMGTLTVGIANAGYDVLFYGKDGSGQFLWDADQDTNGGVTMTGSFDMTGDMGIVGATVITGTVTISSTLTMAGATTLNEALTVGTDGTGHDITIYSDTASYSIIFDQNGDTNGSLAIGNDTHGIMFNLYGGITGCGVFWDPNTDTNGTLTIGGSGGSKGVDVVMYGKTNTKYFKWDQSADGVVLVGTFDATGAATIEGATQITGALTVGVSGTGHDVIFYGATAGAYVMWDESGDDLLLVKASLTIGAAAIGITFNGANTTACISMDGATLANGDNEIEMRNNVSGDKTIIASGTATSDADIVTAVGADANIADGSIYLSSTDGGGALFVKIDDLWTAVVYA